MRTPLALTAAAVLVLGLAGCSSAPVGSVACDRLASPGNATKAVTVTGEFGKKPDVKFASGLTVSQTESVDAITGTGAVAVAGSSITIEAEIFNAKTGELMQSTAYDGNSTAKIPVDVKKLGGISKAVQCHTAGSRVVAVIGNDETLATSLGLSKNDTIVAVFDIVKVNPTKADGVAQVIPDGFPQVVLNDAGVPGITIPNTPAPTELKIAVMKKGSGATVPAHANVTVQYLGVVWEKNAEPFDSSWQRGTPADFSVDQVVPGFRDAIVGQTIGSQILVVIPPKLGYGSQASGAIPANSTLVFVIDILGAN